MVSDVSKCELLLLKTTPLDLMK